MALSSASTETDALNQYYDNVDGWRGNATKASALLGAMEWLFMRHAARRLSDEGSSVVLSDSFERLHEEARDYVKTNNTAASPMFGRTRVGGLG
jgi:hypothetical protein